MEMTHSIVPARVFNKKTAALALLLALSGFSPYLSAVTCNGETVNSTRPKAPNPENPYPNFGVHVYARTHISSTNCDWYATKNAETNNYESYPTGVTDDSYNATTSGQDNRGRPIDLLSNVTAVQSDFGGGSTVLRRNYGSTFADVSLGDTLWFDKPEAAADEVTHIPVKLCFEYSSRWTPETSTTSGTSAASAMIQVDKFDYNGIASQDSYTLDTNIAQVESGQWISQQCNSGSLDMTGPGAGYTLRLLLQNTGQTGQEVDSGTGTAMVTKDGALTGRFQISSLPGGVRCRSASKMFPGCENYQAPDLSLSNIRVTQAVFDSNFNNDDKTDLVKDRETAILVDVDVLQGNVADTVLLGGQYTDALGTENEETHNFQVQKVTIPSGEKTVPAALFFTPRQEGAVKIFVAIDTGNKVDEANEKNNSNVNNPVLADVHSTNHLTIRYLPLIPPTCANGSCTVTPQELKAHADGSNNIIWNTFPLSEIGLQWYDSIINPLHGEKWKLAYANTVCGKRPFSEGYIHDLETMERMYAGSTKRVVGVVPKEYFIYNFPDVGPNLLGMHSPNGGGSAVIVLSGAIQATPHELGHTFNFDEGYRISDTSNCTVDEDARGEIVEGFNISTKEYVSNALDFMGSAKDTNIWVSTTHWDGLFHTLSTQTPDPELIVINAIFRKSGEIELSDWDFVSAGVPDTLKAGNYSIELSNHKGKVIEKIPFDLSFVTHLDPLGEIEMDLTYISHAIKYPKETASVAIIAPDGLIMVETDPVRKTLSDAVKAIPAQCLTGDADQQRQMLDDDMQLFEELLAAGDTAGTIAQLQEVMRNDTDSVLIDQCDEEHPLVTTKESLIALIDNSIERLEYRLDPVTAPPPCESSLNVEPGRCAGNYQAYSLDDLQAYVSATYGRDTNPKGHYMNLQIMGNLDAEELLIETPCKVSVAGNISLSGTQSVKVDGQLGITGKNGIRIDTPAACILSGQGKVTMGANLTAMTKTFNVDAVDNVKIGKNAEITANDRASIQSATGQSSLEAQSRIDGEKIRIIGNAVSIGKAAVLNALDTLHVEAMAPEKCTISDTAALNGASISGNCLESQPATVQEQ